MAKNLLPFYDQVRVVWLEFVNSQHHRQYFPLDSWGELRFENLNDVI